MIYKALILMLVIATGYGRGLKKPTDLKSGYTAEHYDLYLVEINYVRSKTTVKLGLWKDKASKESGKAPIKRLSFEVDGVANIVNERAILNKLKQLDQFSDAVED